MSGVNPILTSVVGPVETTAINSEALLQQIVDFMGGTKAFNYTDGILTSIVITTASGSTITQTFGYTGGLITSITRS